MCGKCVTWCDCRDGFKAEKHNTFLVEQRLWREQEARQEEERRRVEQFWLRLKDDLGDHSQPAFTWPRCVLESLMFITWLALIPLSYLATELLFYFGTLHINEDLLEILYK